jgi:hypothetical protein
MATGQQDGFSLDSAQQAGAYGAAFGGVFGAGAGTARAAGDAGGFTELFPGVRLPVHGPRLAPVGITPTTRPPLIREGEQNAWPRDKRKGPVKPRYRADLAGDEGKKGGHTLERHAAKADDELRARLRSDKNISGSSSFIDEASAQRFADGAVLQKQSEVKRWLESETSQAKVIKARFDDVTGRSLSREDFIRGTGPHNLQGIKLVLRRDSDMPSGFRIHTSFPTP